MRKRMFLSFLLILGLAVSGANAAVGNNRRGGTSANAGNSSQSSAPATTARVATRGAVARSASAQPAQTAARATPAINVAPKTGTRQAPAASSPSTTQKARAATSTQKVINNGTKVATATANTVIDKECQDAFYGCMDSFCMIDNESGGRCQCSDRNAELKQVMDDIAKLDEQSYAMATEGVERIKMGESADAIIARAKAAGDLAASKTQAEENAKKARTLDLDIWNTSVFSEIDDDIFDEVQIGSSTLSNALNKTGNKLYADSAKMCVAQIPDKCKSSLQLLQSIYASKIKSDCVAFENSLKQQKIASTQKLQTAEKALRDAALEEFQDQNKYNLGQCVQRYSQCMQNECGTDYSQCITFAAEENIKGSKVNDKARTIKGVVDIVLSGSTMNQILSKKTICDDEVLTHCVNVRAQVWDKYIEYAATALKSAEVIAEDNLRQNCIKNVADCFKNSCAQQWDPNSDEVNYDMCLSDPMLVYDSCKIKVEACVIATGAKNTDEKGLQESSLWRGVTSMLAALRVDACTREVKSGIESICGEDFIHCAGLNPGTIAELLPTDTLTACKEKNNNDKNQILQYVADVAQGYALQMNDAMYSVCENAAKQAMISVCGTADTCDTLNLGNMSFEGLLEVKLCKEKDDGKMTCYDSVNDPKVTESDIIAGAVRPHIRNRLNINNISFGENGNKKYKADNMDALYENKFEYNSENSSISDDFIDMTNTSNAKAKAMVNNIIDGLNNVFKNKLDVMLNTKVVYDCMHGKKVTGFKNARKSDGTLNADAEGNPNRKQSWVGEEYSEANPADRAYAHLLDEYVAVMASKTLELLKEKYDQAEKDLEPQISALNNQISERLASIKSVEEEEIQESNRLNCELMAAKRNIENNYNPVKYGDNGTAKQLKVSINNGKIEYSREHSCERWDYCQLGEALFFKTTEGRNYRNRGGLYWVTYSYNELTNECTLTTTHYECTYYLDPYCHNFDTTGVQLSTPEVIKMPTSKKSGSGSGSSVRSGDDNTTSTWTPWSS